jgi:hypothetical protein
MRVRDETIHQRKVVIHLDEEDLKAVLSNYAAESTGFKIVPGKTEVRVIISKHDTSTGFKTQAEVVLINDLDDEGMENG